MINTGDIANELRPGLNKVFGLYTQYPDQWKEIYKTSPSIMAQEIDTEMQFLGPASIVAEGANIPASTMGQRVVTNYIHSKVAIKFVITKEAIEDNLYKTQFPQQVEAFRNSMRQTKNTLGSNVLNNAFNPLFQIGDGQSLCSANHPISTGTYSNTFAPGGVAVDFSEAGLEQAIIQIQQFPDQAGLITATKPLKLIIPRALQFSASRILGSSFMPNTANNAINPINQDDYFPEKYKVNQFLVSSVAWFIITDAPTGMRHFQRTNVESDMYPTYDNETITVQASERYSFGCSNPRGIFGSPGM